MSDANIKVALTGVVSLVKEIVALEKASKDQLADAAALGTKILTDEAFRAQIVAALQAIPQIGAEIKTVTLADGIDLAVTLLQLVQQA